MRDEDEKFLKDALWSETWFPWKSKTQVIVVHGDKTQRWQKIAAVLSALALLVSLAAMNATRQQVSLMRAQLTANDRNAATVELAKLLIGICQTIAQGPANATRYEPYEDRQGQIYLLPIISGKMREVTPDERDEFGRKLIRLVGESNAAMVAVSMFNNEETMKKLATIQRLAIEHAQAALNVVTDDSVEHLDHGRLRSLSTSCEKVGNSAMKGSKLSSLQSMNESSQ